MQYKLILATLLTFAPITSFAAAYKYRVATGAIIKPSCTFKGVNRDTHIKLYMSDNVGKANSDQVRVKVHVCAGGELLRSNFSIALPLKAWGASGSGNFSFTIPASTMKNEFGVNGSGPVAVTVVDQNSLAGVPGFVVGKHFPLKSLRIKIPGYGVTLNATLARIQKD